MFDDDMIGAPEVQSEFCEQQIFSDNCAVVAETSIINQFCPGLNLDQETATYISASNGWYHPGEGTSPDVIGNLMDKYGIDNHTNTCATIEDLAWELEQGHGVIVSVNSAELWDSGPFAELKHELLKACGLDNPVWTPADHAITITGIDKSDPDHPMAIVNDSAVGATVRWPMEKFEDAWENGGCYYVATDAPLPSLQNVVSGPSGSLGGINASGLIPDVAGLASAGIASLFTKDPMLISKCGQFAQTITAKLLDDDFARSI